MMRKVGPSTERERVTLLKLREALPEYEINPHMRLANVVKGRLSYTRAMGQYELDFVVQKPATGEVICAIELDDPTHDTDDGRRRDANKNRWMAQAKIKLIRIREPDEALLIKEQIEQPYTFTIPEEPVYVFQKLRPNAGIAQGLLSISLVIGFGLLVIWGITGAVKGVAHKASEQATLRVQQVVASQQAKDAERLRLQQEQARLQATNKSDSIQPHYERVIVKGKSAKECGGGNVITNETIRCMKDHFEMVLVSGNQ